MRPSHECARHRHRPAYPSRAGGQLPHVLSPWGGGGGACNAETDIFQAKCGGVGCHSPPATVANGLDLISPGVASRLLGPSMCNGLPLRTYMITKLTSTSPPCGSQMPLGGPFLSSDQIQCVSDYLAALPGSDAGTPDDGGTDGGDGGP